MYLFIFFRRNLGRSEMSIKRVVRVKNIFANLYLFIYFFVHIIYLFCLVVAIRERRKFYFTTPPPTHTHGGHLNHDDRKFKIVSISINTL